MGGIVLWLLVSTCPALSPRRSGSNPAGPVGRAASDAVWTVSWVGAGTAGRPYPFSCGRPRVVPRGPAHLQSKFVLRLSLPGFSSRPCGPALPQPRRWLEAELQGTAEDPFSACPASPQAGRGVPPLRAPQGNPLAPPSLFPEDAQGPGFTEGLSLVHKCLINVCQMEEKSNYCQRSSLRFLGVMEILMG